MEAGWWRVRGLQLHAVFDKDRAVEPHPAIVLVHGLGASHRYMIPLIQELAPFYPVYAPDLPGFGLSEKPPKAYNIPQLADALGDWIQTAELKQPVLLGNSMGCEVIVDLAARRPASLCAAILQGPTTNPRHRRVWQQMWELFLALQREPKPELKKILWEDHRTAGLFRMIQTSRYALEDKIETKLPLVKVPTLVVVGDQDASVPVPWAEKVSKLLPKGRLAVVEGAAHAINYSFPAAMRRLTVDFLRATFASLFLSACPLVLQAADPQSDANQSVYEIKPWVDGPVLGVAALGAVLPIAYQKHLVHKTSPGDERDENSFDRHVIGNHSNVAAWISHFTVSLAIATPIFLDYKDLGFSQTYTEDLIVFGEVLSIDTSINNAFRYSVQRPRPEAYRKVPPPTDPGSYLSFDAGHVANTVAALSAASMTYNYRYGPHALPWVITGVVGVSEGFMRSAAGKHFYTDDILGMAVGATVGTLVPYLHHRKHSSTSVSLLPTETGAQLVWTREF